MFFHIHVSWLGVTKHFMPLGIEKNPKDIIYPTWTHIRLNNCYGMVWFAGLVRRMNCPMSHVWVQRPYDIWRMNPIQVIHPVLRATSSCSSSAMLALTRPTRFWARAITFATSGSAILLGWNAFDPAEPEIAACHNLWMGPILGQAKIDHFLRRFWGFVFHA